MKLRSFIHRRYADRIPLLPSTDPDDPADGGRPSTRRAKTDAREERLERLLTPGELEIVEQHRW
ncbi:hypothetical protein [Nocardia arizonensis]|uniref:hypothetical protein n=1 Tax=Nocardia arizonensis TaxID=1141647 RepID=UPI0006CF8959|nr:hypothetical protein [Nocardia arizonensis]